MCPIIVLCLPGMETVELIEEGNSPYQEIQHLILSVLCSSGFLSRLPISCLAFEVGAVS